MKRLDLFQIVFVALATGATSGCVVEDDRRHEHHVEERHEEQRREEHHEERREERHDEERRCPHCGVRLAVGVRVCGGCGVEIR